VQKICVHLANRGYAWSFTLYYLNENDQLSAKLDGEFKLEFPYKSVWGANVAQAITHQPS